MAEEDIRQEAVQRHILGGESPKTICKSINRSKQWFFKWLNRYKTGAANWYKEQSRAPKTSPLEITPAAKERIILTRQRLEASPYAQIGVSAIKWELKKLGLPFPADRTINRVIKDEGLVKKNSLCPQGSRISIFHGGTVQQQRSPDGLGGTALHQRRRQILFYEHYQFIRP